MSDVSWGGKYQPHPTTTDSETGQAANVVFLELRDTVDSAVEAIERLRSDGRYNDDHKRTKSRETAVEAAWRVRKMAEAELPDLAASLAEERAALRSRAVAPRKPSDAAGELRDQEVRALLRGMEPPDRAKFLMTQAPADVLEAALRAPPMLTGISEDIHGELTERAVRTRHADAFEDLEAAEKNVEAIRRAVRNGYEILGDAVDTDFVLPEGEDPDPDPEPEPEEEEPEPAGAAA